MLEYMFSSFTVSKIDYYCCIYNLFTLINKIVYNMSGFQFGKMHKLCTYKL